jgi:hypothetical protein
MLIQQMRFEQFFKLMKTNRLVNLILTGKLFHCMTPSYIRKDCINEELCRKKAKLWLIHLISLYNTAERLTNILQIQLGTILLNILNIKLHKEKLIRSLTKSTLS